MACVNPDGSTTVVAQQVMAALHAGGSVEDAAKAAGLPVYRVRSSLRELVAAGLVVAGDDGAYALTDQGRDAIAP